MTEKKIKCMRCRGMKQMYKVGSGYSFADMGGLRVDCPMCKGEGVIESLDEFKNVEPSNLQESSTIKAPDVGLEKEAVFAVQNKEVSGKIRAKRIK